MISVEGAVPRRFITGLGWRAPCGSDWFFSLFHLEEHLEHIRSQAPALMLFAQGYVGVIK